MTIPDPLATHIYTGGLPRVCEELAKLMRACARVCEVTGCDGSDGYQLPKLEQAPGWLHRSVEGIESESRKWPAWKRDAASADPHLGIPDPHPAPTPSPGEDKPMRECTDGAYSAAIRLERERDAAREELERVTAENARLTSELAEAMRMGKQLGESSGAIIINLSAKLTESERLVSELRAELAKREAVVETRSRLKAMTEHARSLLMWANEQPGSLPACWTALTFEAGAAVAHLAALEQPQAGPAIVEIAIVPGDWPKAEVVARRDCIPCLCKSGSDRVMVGEKHAEHCPISKLQAEEEREA